MYIVYLNIGLLEIFLFPVDDIFQESHRVVAAALPFAGQTEMRPVCAVAVIGGGAIYVEGARGVTIGGYEGFSCFCSTF